jgi:hypothetical protein
MSKKSKLCLKSKKHIRSKKCSKHLKHSKCSKLLYSIGAWADNRVVEIRFVPFIGSPISWSTTNNTLDQSSPTLSNHWNMQSPITSSQFPIFPLEIFNGDKFIFVFENDTNTPNAFACAANINGNIYRTINSTDSLINEIKLEPTTGFGIIDPLYSPITDLATRNIIDTINYISIDPNNSPSYMLTWTI